MKFKCKICGKEWREGCNSISGDKEIIIYTICDECLNAIDRETDKLLKKLKLPRQSSGVDG